MDNVGLIRFSRGRRLDLLPIYLVVIFAAMVTSHINMALDIGRPFGGFLSYYNVNNSGGVEYIDKERNPPSWPIFESGKLTYEDQILTIDEQKYRSPYVAGIYSQLWEEGKDSATLGIDRSGTRELVDISIKKFTFGQYLEVSIPNFLVGLGFWLVAVVIYRGQPYDPLNRITALLAAAAAGFGGTTPSSLFGNNVGNILEIVSFLCFGLIGPATIHLALCFPRPLAFSSSSITTSLSKISLKLLYGVGIGFSFFYVFSKLLFWNDFSSEIVVVLNRSASYMLYIFLGFAYVIFCGRLIFVALKDPSPRHRRESLLLLVGMAFCLPPIFLLIARAFSFDLSSYLGPLNLNYLLLALPIALCVTILRYKTFRPLPSLFMIVPIIMISALLATIQTTVTIYGNLVTDSNAIFLYLTGFFLAFLSSSIWTSQSSWRGIFRRLLHWDRATIDEVRRFGEGMLAQQDLTALPAATAPALCQFLQLERAAVWTWQGKTFDLVSQCGHWPNPLPIQLKETILPDEPIRLTRLTRQAGIPFSDRDDVEVLVPLSITAEPVGLLALGKRWDEAVFDERDLEAIALIGQQVSLFLLSARQIERLRQVPHQLSEAQERERNRLAQELHDTTEQFLGRLPFTLEEVHMELQENSKKAGRLIKRCLEEIDQEARTLRHIRHAMAPIQLEYGFTPALERLVESFRLRTGVPCNLGMPEELEYYLLPQVRLPLYRVIQQALDNIDRHAAADFVEISLIIAEEKIHFHIADNGKGSSEEVRFQAQSEGSFGLKSMAARIQNLGGVFQFESAIGEGTRINGWIPR